MAPRSTVYRVLRAVASGFARADGWLERGAGAGRRLLGGLLSEALDAEEQSAIGPALYDARSSEPDGLEPWEEVWLAERLPIAPASILIGGAGRGREAVALARKGYAVAAFDPRLAGIDACRARLGSGAMVACARYEDLASRVLDGSSGAADRIASHRFDAVLAGWGSLAHVLDARERERVLVALDCLAPNGPILASFPTIDASCEEPTRVSRTERAGRAVGKRIAAWRGVSPRRGPTFAPHCGFAARIGHDEIERLARAVGRRAVIELGAYPHVTWIPAARDRSRGA